MISRNSNLVLPFCQDPCHQFSRIYPFDLALCFLQRIRFNVSRVPIWLNESSEVGPENRSVIA